MRSNLPRTFDSFAFNYSDYVGPAGPQGPQGPAGTSDVDYAFVDVTAATYNVVETDYFIGVSYTATGSVNINLPQISSVGKTTFTIVDTGGNASVNNITVNPFAGDTIIGTTSVVINADYNSIVIINNGITGWFVI